MTAARAGLYLVTAVLQNAGDAVKCHSGHVRGLGEAPPRRPFGEPSMKAMRLIPVLKWVGLVVLLLMAVAVGWAAFIAISYWPSIRV